MKIRLKAIGTVLAAGMLLTVSTDALAGNEDRAGSAGATELLINPFARSSGWGDAATASATGLDAMFLNIGGLAFAEKTEVMFSRTSWLGGAGVDINAAGLAQRIGESSVLGIGLMAMTFGDLEITTTELPEGGIGTFSPQYTNFGLSYAKEFSNSIYGGVNVKIISQSIADAKAQGVAFDAGIRYVTGERDHIHFGIALRNVGPQMSFSGDGFSITSVPQGASEELALEQRSGRFELPSLVNIGVAYDFHFTELHKLTAAGNFTSNSFTKDQFKFGVNYLFDGPKAKFSVRAGYVYEDKVGDDIERTVAHTGPTAGASVSLPTGSSGSIISIDYSYRTSNPFDGSHSIGASITIGRGDSDELPE